MNRFRHIVLFGLVVLSLPLSTVVSESQAAEDVVDTCEKTDNFFLFPGESSTGSLKAKDGHVELAKSEQGDAFIRWSTKAMKRIPLNTKQRWVSIDFDKFTKKGTAAVVYAEFFKNKKHAGKGNIATVKGGPEKVVVDIKALAEKSAPEADTFWIFIRHGNDPKGVIKINEIRLSENEPEVKTD